MQRIVLDANVLVSYLTGRHEKQYDAARVLLQEAENGNLVAILPAVRRLGSDVRSAEPVRRER